MFALVMHTTVVLSLLLPVATSFFTAAFGEGNLKRSSISCVGFGEGIRVMSSAVNVSMLAADCSADHGGCRHMALACVFISAHEVEIEAIGVVASRPGRTAFPEICPTRKARLTRAR